MKKIYLFLFLFTAFIKADTITITSDAWCPYNCDEKSEKQGFLVDIFTYIFKQYGYEVEYVVSSSYAKAIKDVRSNKYDALIATTHDETPDFLFPKLPIAYSYDVILIAKDSEWKYTSEESLNELTLGLIKGYIYDEPIQRHISLNRNNPKKIQIISGNHALEYNLKKLQYKKITATIDDQLLIKYNYTSKQDVMPFKIAERMETYPLYIAFSPKNYKSQRYVEMFNRGFKRLLHTKQMEKILQKYNLTEENILKPQ